MVEALFVEFEVSLGPSRSLSYGDAVSPPAETSMLHLNSATVLIGLRHLFHSPLDSLPNAQCRVKDSLKITARDESNAKAEMVHTNTENNRGPRSQALSVTP